MIFLARPAANALVFPKRFNRRKRVIFFRIFTTRICWNFSGKTQNKLSSYTYFKGNNVFLKKFSFFLVIFSGKARKKNLVGDKI